MAVEVDNTARPSTPMSMRTCRYCGRPFAWPKGSKQMGCTHCAPRLAIDEASR